MRDVMHGVEMGRAQGSVSRRMNDIGTQAARRVWKSPSRRTAPSCPAVAPPEQKADDVGIEQTHPPEWVGDLHVRLSSSNTVEFSVDNRTVRTGPSGAALLDLFQKPTTIAEAADALTRRLTGRQAWIAAMVSILNLRRTGLLVDTDGVPRGYRIGPPDGTEARYISTCSTTGGARRAFSPRFSRS